MEINFTYSKQEWIYGYRRYQFLVKRVTKLQLIVMTLLPILLAARISMNGMTTGRLILIILCIITYLITGYAMLIIPHIVYRKVEKYQNAYKLTFTEDNIIFESKDINSVLAWDVYSKYCETEDFFYLLQDKVSYSLIPKRAFASKEQREQFRKLLENKLKEY